MVQDRALFVPDSLAARSAQYEHAFAFPAEVVYNKGQFNVYIIEATTNRVHDATGAVEYIHYEYNDQTPYATISVSFVQHWQLKQLAVPPNWILVYGPYFNNADPLFTGATPEAPGPDIYGGGTTLYNEIDRGIITYVENTSSDEKGSFRVVAKDPTWILTKNTIPYKMPKGTLTERLRFIEGRGLIRLREPIIRTEHVLAATRGGQNTVWDDISWDLGETNRAQDKRYVLRHRKGEFFLAEITNQRKMWAFEYGSNIMELRHSQSIEEYFNRIYVISQTDSALNDLFGIEDNPTSLKIQYVGFSEDEESQKSFGQHTLIVGQEASEEFPTAQAQAQKLLEDLGKVQQEAVLTSYSLTGMRWGDQILIYEPVTGLGGAYWVRGGRHVIEAGHATMALDIAFDRVVPDSVRRQQQDITSDIFANLGLGPGDNFSGEFSAEEIEAAIAEIDASQ